MLASERIRLLREDPWEATALAQELFAMFSDDTDPTELGSSASLQWNGVTPIQIGGLPATDAPVPVIQFGRHDGSSVNISISSGGLTFETTTPDGQTTPQEILPVVQAAASKSQTQTFPGKVISGSGNTYSVAVYPRGTGNDPVTVNVIQLQIDPSETIPADTWAIVTRTSDGNYWMQVAVWL